MTFEETALLGSFLAKDHARDILRLLYIYDSLSATEAASRLGLHIKTAQEFLETLANLDLLKKTEASEQKRPYFRYSLKKNRISVNLDLTILFRKPSIQDLTAKKIRERQNSGALFSVARGGNAISNITIWKGTGRDKKERKIHLTGPQGKFLFHLPFPSAEPLSMSAIMKKSGVSEKFQPEILDLIQLLESHNVIRFET